MSQRESGYKRAPGDLYETPEWVTGALLPFIPRRIKLIWEPAAGSGKMVAVLEQRLHTKEVTRTDILAHPTAADPLPRKSINFLNGPQWRHHHGVITNPPYTLATEFIDTALDLTSARRGFVAMLLRTDFDHAKTRRHLFADHPAFCRKLVLTKRIVWFERKGASPSFNHAWYMWDWRHKGPPVLAYDFQEKT